MGLMRKNLDTAMVEKLKVNNNFWCHFFFQNTDGQNGAWLFALWSVKLPLECQSYIIESKLFFKSINKGYRRFLLNVCRTKLLHLVLQDNVNGQFHPLLLHKFFQLLRAAEHCFAQYSSASFPVHSSVHLFSSELLNSIKLQRMGSIPFFIQLKILFYHPGLHNTWNLRSPPGA